jgi:hypothetical protein
MRMVPALPSPSPTREQGVINDHVVVQASGGYERRQSLADVAETSADPKIDLVYIRWRVTVSLDKIWSNTRSIKK